MHKLNNIINNNINKLLYMYGDYIMNLIMQKKNT